jgi:hypothetical protein
MCKQRWLVVLYVSLTDHINLIDRRELGLIVPQTFVPVQQRVLGVAEVTVMLTPSPTIANSTWTIG